MEDPDLLPELFVRVPHREWVLVTADDTMPDEWADVIAWLRPTLATIDPQHPAELTDDEWGRDVVHRWAHVMQTQAAHSIRRYRLSGHGLWKLRRRSRRPGATL